MQSLSSPYFPLYTFISFNIVAMDPHVLLAYNVAATARDKTINEGRKTDPNLRMLLASALTYDTVAKTLREMLEDAVEDDSVDEDLDLRLDEKDNVRFKNDKENEDDNQVTTAPWPDDVVQGEDTDAADVESRDFEYLTAQPSLTNALSTVEEIEMSDDDILDEPSSLLSFPPSPKQATEISFKNADGKTTYRLFSHSPPIHRDRKEKEEYNGDGTLTPPNIQREQPSVAVAGLKECNTQPEMTGIISKNSPTTRRTCALESLERCIPPTSPNYRTSISRPRGNALAYGLAVVARLLWSPRAATAR